MKRYLVFSGSDYYPSGGWTDFKGSIDSLESLSNIYEFVNGDDWWHIVDSTTGEIVDRWKKS